MKLSPHEISTPLWGKLATHYEERLSKCRTRLETKIEESETITLRAQIREIRAFLELAEPGRKTPSDAG